MMKNRTLAQIEMEIRQVDNEIKEKTKILKAKKVQSERLDERVR